jgi:hypothetical protein
MEIKRFFARSVVVVLLLVVALSIPSFGQTNREPRLRYAQVASGQSGSQTYVTTLLVSNANNFAVPAAIDSSDAANPNNSIGLGFQTNCAVDSSSLFTIAAFSSCRFTSTYNGPLKTGWLGVTENPQPSGSSGVDPIGGYLVFTLWQGNQFTGYPIFTVGVSPTPIYYQFSIPVVRDTASNTDVGFAMANPFSDGPTGVVAQLVDSSGNVVEQQNITLSTLGRQFCGKFSCDGPNGERRCHCHVANSTRCAVRRRSAHHDVGEGGEAGQCRYLARGRRDGPRA